MAVDAAWVALSLVGRVGSKTIQALLAEFGSVEAVLQAEPAQLKRVKGVGDKIARAIAALDVQQTKKVMHAWQAQGVRIIPSYSSSYPVMLLGLNDEPPTVFVRGAYQPTLWGKTVAIVGTRTPSERGRAIALSLAAQLAGMRYTIVSGLALGIDAAAHEGALSSQYGRTLAVLGSGVLNIYPAQHEKLAARIMQQGTIVSENHPFAEATAPRLVSRNRIITGLAQHIVIAETPIGGGAMYAARFAAQQGRAVYALDLPASGNQHLLHHEGAIPITPDLQALPLG